MTCRSIALSDTNMYPVMSTPPQKPGFTAMATKNFIKHKQLSRAALCFLCFFVVLSFVAPLLPVANASSDTMPCCAGKAHCDSGIAPKRVLPPTSEPMCGLKDATMEDDGITIVAEPVHTQHSYSRNASSSGPAAESASISKPCHMDCGACLAGLNRQNKRDRVLVPTFAVHSSTQTTSATFEYQSVRFSSNDDWKQTSPRGPPAAHV